jgi:hypothetical protein
VQAIAAAVATACLAAALLPIRAARARVFRTRSDDSLLEDFLAVSEGVPALRFLRHVAAHVDFVQHSAMDHRR